MNVVPQHNVKLYIFFQSVFENMDSKKMSLIKELLRKPSDSNTGDHQGKTTRLTFQFK